MGIFGWSYPPGCSGPPEHYERCEICNRAAENCECPECPVCNEQGRADCYAEGHIAGPMPERREDPRESEPPPDMADEHYDYHQEPY